jgi:two-component sensor histidine kinase
VGTLSRIARDRTDLSGDDVQALSDIVEEWSLIADLAMGDLVLWAPTWNEAGLVALAQVRPTTTSTVVPDDLVGTYAPRGRHPQLDQAFAFGRAVMVRADDQPLLPVGTEAYPIRSGGRVIAVLSRYVPGAPRTLGRLEEAYLSTADDLLAMVSDEAFPVVETASDTTETPRVGDGLLRIDDKGVVTYASPNAMSALRRLGLARNVVGTVFAEIAVRLSHRPGRMDEALSAVARGRASGRADIENPAATVLVRGIPLTRGTSGGAVLFLQDVTDLRRRERALISKDATIREIHHRVKNNLQTVAAMLRLQARRASADEARQALGEAELRVAAIAIVHESLSGEVGEQVDFDEIADRVVALVRDLAPAYETEDQRVPELRRVGSWGALPGDLATPLAMIASELLHNAVEHAQATAVTLVLARGDRDLLLTVRDDGRGLPDEFDAADTGLGLSIVQSLATGDLHGTCAIERAEDGGTQARIGVPLPPE